MGGVFVFPFYFSSCSDLLRFNNKERTNIPCNIGTFVAVEHYRRQGRLSVKDSHQVLVHTFQKLWPVKLSKGEQPYNVWAQRFYAKALQLQHQSDRFNQFCRVDTANKAFSLTLINAIASFPAEPLTEAAASNSPPTTAPTLTPLVPNPINKDEVDLPVPSQNSNSKRVRVNSVENNGNGESSNHSLMHLYRRISQPAGSSPTTTLLPMMARNNTVAPVEDEAVSQPRSTHLSTPKANGGGTAAQKAHELCSRNGCCKEVHHVGRCRLEQRVSTRVSHSRTGHSESFCISLNLGYN